jgi:hypothetical protein
LGTVTSQNPEWQLEGVVVLVDDVDDTFVAEVVVLEVVVDEVEVVVVVEVAGE